MTKAVGVMIDAVPTWHAPAAAPTDSDTRCGIDADDPAIGFTGLLQARRAQKITCSQCKTTWERLVAMRLRASDFA